MEDLIGLGAPTTTAAPTTSTTDDLLGLGAPAATNQPAAMQSIDDLLGGPAIPPANQAAAQSQPVAPTYSLDNMFGGGVNTADSLLGIGMPSAAQPDVQLAPESDCDGEKFQTLWMQLPDCGQVNLPIKQNWICNVAEIKAKMEEAKIFTMASGLVGDEIKFYFHAKLADGSGYGFAEIIFK